MAVLSTHRTFFLPPLKEDGGTIDLQHFLTIFRHYKKTAGLPLHHIFYLPPFHEDGGTIASPHFLTILKLDPRYGVGSCSAESKMTTRRLFKVFALNSLEVL
jgi:hypothetical protein